MKTDQHRLTNFVLRESVDKNLALQALAVVDPFFTEANVGLYPLDVAWHVDKGAAMAALDQAFEKPVAGLQIFAGTAGAGLGTNEALPNDIVSSATKLLNEFRDELCVQLDGQKIKDLTDTVYETLGMMIHRNIMTVYAPFFGQLDTNDANTLALTPLACVFYLLGFAMLGDVDMFKRLKPLVELCRHAVPIGESVSEPGKWLLLAG